MNIINDVYDYEKITTEKLYNSDILCLFTNYLLLNLGKENTYTIYFSQ